MKIADIIEKGIIKKDRLEKILGRLDEISKIEKVFPEPKNVFRCLDNLEKTKVVILGQDPYHGLGQANRILLCCKCRYSYSTKSSKYI